MRGREVVLIDFKAAWKGGGKDELDPEYQRLEVLLSVISGRGSSYVEDSTPSDDVAGLML